MMGRSLPAISQLRGDLTCRASFLLGVHSTAGFPYLITRVGRAVLCPILHPLPSSPPYSVSLFWQVVTNRDTQELLLCTAYVFEVSTSERGAQHHIYRLVRD